MQMPKPGNAIYAVFSVALPLLAGVFLKHPLAHGQGTGISSPDGQAATATPVDPQWRARAARYLDLMRQSSSALELKNHAAAEARIHEALAEASKVFGSDSEEAARATGMLGRVLGSAGKQQEGEAASRRALAMLIKLLGPEHSVTRLARNDLASALINADAGQKEAEQLLRSLIESEKAKNPQSRRLLEYQSGLITTLMYQSKLREAEDIAAESIEIAKTAFGPRSAEVANSLADNGRAIQHQGKRGRAGEAITKYREAIAIFDELGRAASSQAIAPLHHLSGALASMRKFDEAEVHGRKALVLAASIYGETHPIVANACLELARILRSAEKYDEAETVAARGLSIFENMLGPRHRLTASAATVLAGVFHVQKKTAEASQIEKKYGVWRMR